MAAKVSCKKGYNTNQGYVEFKSNGTPEVCPVSNATNCEGCNAKVFEME
ncbi:MAG: hypothetical protein KJ915_08960 [Candidatus Omnitrophica bacterium]|nr:hypothetical protein [Candidatus Omnitrophota bacterium]